MSPSSYIQVMTITVELYKWYEFGLCYFIIVYYNRSSLLRCEVNTFCKMMTGLKTQHLLPGNRKKEEKLVCFKTQRNQIVSVILCSRHHKISPLTISPTHLMKVHGKSSGFNYRAWESLLSAQNRSEMNASL